MAVYGRFSTQLAGISKTPAERHDPAQNEVASDVTRLTHDGVKMIIAASP
jgi:hypothetical protein